MNKGVDCSGGRVGKRFLNHRNEVNGEGTEPEKSSWIFPEWTGGGVRGGTLKEKGLERDKGGCIEGLILVRPL